MTKTGLFIFIFLLSLHFQALSQQYQYQRVYLSGKDAASAIKWDFKISDGRKAGEWNQIPVPSNWELHGFGTYNYGHDHSNKGKKLGKEKGFYLHQFEVPAKWKGKSINIVFAGSMTDTEVNINGKLAGPIHQGAFYEFKYDISNLLNYGLENLLEITVSKHSSNPPVNAAEREADFWIFGGIFRPVYLEVLPQIHFKRMAINAQHNGQLEALLETNKAVKSGQVKLELFDKDMLIGKYTKSFQGNTDTLRTSFSNIISWNPERPQLYTAKFTLMDKDQPLFSKSEKIGFRTVELREKDGIYVNKVKVVFKGVNRHSFYPSTGRALSRKNHLEDIQLIKEMNMNAVRMSHYPPDEEFLDLCDSLGLFVLDEVTGWQDGYDTIVGPKLIKETVLKDENHPSVVVWDHGNEGGWDFRNEKWFHRYDIQKRPIIYPWLNRNGVDTFHYPTFDAGIHRLSNGQNIFMPTEFLHGLYDGGHGAGLEDFWNNYMKNPAAAGGFLWAFADEAVLRTDRSDSLDADGNHAPDGIVGPYREKEGSFYTIKDIWSPIQLKPMVVNRHYNGKLIIENQHLYTDLTGYQLQWKLMKQTSWQQAEVRAGDQLLLDGIKPQESKSIHLNLGEEIKNADWLAIHIMDKNGQLINQWSWPIVSPAEFTHQNLQGIEGKTSTPIIQKQDNEQWIVQANGISYTFELKTVQLSNIQHKDRLIPFSGPVGGTNRIAQTHRKWEDQNGNWVLEASFDSYPKKVRWTIQPNGLLGVQLAAPDHRMKNVDYLGVNFSFPEEEVIGVQWMGSGPYRVWQNRLRGPKFGLWSNAYNNTITGHSFENLVYPEFKGYFKDFFAYQLQTKEESFQVYTETPGLFFRLFSPENSPHNTSGLEVPFPKGDLSFLYKIPPIGTKFHNAAEMGPQGHPASDVMHLGDKKNDIILWFDFR